MRQPKRVRLKESQLGTAAMQSLFADTLNWMDDRLYWLEKLIPQPTKIRIEGAVAYRYPEKTPQIALVLRLARIVSGLRASTYLWSAGLLQEQAAICRMVNEFQDDVTFLTLAQLEEEQPPLLHRFLEAFFAEENSAKNFRSGVRVKGHDTPNRKNILNYISQHPASGGDPFTGSNASLALSFAISGYVHGSAEHIVEMFDPAKRRLVTNVWPENPFCPAHERDLRNYFYRGVLAFGFAGVALNDDSTKSSVLDFRKLYEDSEGNPVGL
ncbi:hypothetical protein [Gymnodinialimonas hymeniacidonis]|uniref:hypothetical protein n=1 Tax=Gymnodinialimonas hymeniacidonis TaxID=3126508 RepID=UPI0034C638A6